MESTEAKAFLSESQEADVDDLVDIFGEQQPIETLRQHVIEHRNDRNRVNIITNQIFTKNNDHIAAGGDNEAEANSDDMSREDKFAILVDMFPNLDFENLQNTLEDCNGDLQKVVDKLSIPSHSTDTQRNSSGQKRQAEKRLDLLNVKQVRFANVDIDQSASGSDFNDQSPSIPITDPQSSVAPKRHNPEEIADRVRALMERFPDANPSALFHRLEECQNLNKTEHELIEELIPPVVELDDMPGPSNRNVSSPNSSCVSKFGEFLSQEERDGLITIVQIFHDVDPNYVFEQIAQKQKTTHVIIEEMTRNSGYPKLKQRREKEKVERRRQEFLDGNKFKMEEYLRIFNDPETYFNDQERTVSLLYIQHAKVHLMNLFPNMKEEFLTCQLELHGNHLLPTIRTIQDGSTRGSGRGRRGTRRKTKNFNMPQYLANGCDRKEPEKWPNQIDEQFFRELQYIQHMDKIKELKQRKETEREERILNGRENGFLEECQCCMSDECLNDEMISCQINEQHKFCKDCIRQHAETQVSDGQHRISCMAGDCKEFISFAIIQSLLRPNEVNLILRRWQQDELRNAQLDNMESCPSCDFAMIIENNDERVFRCQNPDCLKETCRECQEPNHIPLRCNEVEKDAETQMRTFIENKMAEAMIRICPKCNNRLIKSDGCNKLMCPCGSAICYVCRKQLPCQDPYSHFTGHANVVNHTTATIGCPLQTTMDQVHADVAETAGREAREEYLRQHPELREMKDIEVNNLVERGAQGAQPVMVFGGLEVPPPPVRGDIDLGDHLHADHLDMIRLHNRLTEQARAAMARSVAADMVKRQERGDLLHADQLAWIRENHNHMAEQAAGSRAVEALMTLRQEPGALALERMTMRERVRREKEAAVFQADPLVNEHATIAKRGQAAYKSLMNPAEEEGRHFRQEINPFHSPYWPVIVQQEAHTQQEQVGQDLHLDVAAYITTGGQMKPADHGSDERRGNNNDQQATMIKPANRQRTNLELEEADRLVQEELEQLRQHDKQIIDETINEVVSRQTPTRSLIEIFDVQPTFAETPTTSMTSSTSVASAVRAKPVIGIFDVQPKYVESPTSSARVTTPTESSASVVVFPNTEIETDMHHSENPVLTKPVFGEGKKKNGHEERLKHLSELRKQYCVLDANLKAVQHALPLAKSSKEGKEILKNVMTCLQQRDKVLHECQQLETELLKVGIAEDKIGRQDIGQFNLTNEEIHGAAQEATALAADAQAIRDQETNQINAEPAASVLPEITITPLEPLFHPQYPNSNQYSLPYAALPLQSRPPLLPNGPPQMKPSLGNPLPNFDYHMVGYTDDPKRTRWPHTLSQPHVNEQLRPDNELENTLRQAQAMLSTTPTAANMEISPFILNKAQNPRFWCEQAEQLLLQAENGGFSYSRLWELIQFMRETFGKDEGFMTGHRVFAMDTHSNEAYVHLGNLWRDFVAQLSCHLIQCTNPHGTGSSRTIAGGGASAHVPPSKTTTLSRPSAKQRICEQKQVITEHRCVSADSVAVQKIECHRRMIGKEPQSNLSELQEDNQQKERASTATQSQEEHGESLNSSAMTPVTPQPTILKVQKARKTLPHLFMKKEMIDKYNKEYQDVVKKLNKLENEGQSEENVERKHKRKKDNERQHILEKPTVKKRRKIEKDVQRQVVERELNALQTTVNAAEMHFFSDLVMNNKLECVALQERRQNAQTLITELRNQIEQLTRQEADAEKELKNIDRTLRHNFAEDQSRAEMKKLHLKLQRLQSKVKNQKNESTPSSSSYSEDPDQPSTSVIVYQPKTQTVKESESEHLLQMIKKGHSMGLQEEIAKSIKSLIEFPEKNKDSRSEDVTKVTKPRTPPVIVLSDDDEDPSDRPEIIYEHRMPQSTVQLIDDSVEIQRMKIPINSGEVDEITQMALAFLCSSSSYNPNDEVSGDEHLSDSATPNPSPQFENLYTEQLEPNEAHRSLSHDGYSERNHQLSLCSTPTTPGPDFRAMPTTMDNGSFFGDNFNAEKVKNEKTVSVSYGETNKQRDTAAGQMHQRGVIQINIHLPQQMSEAQELLEQLNDRPEVTGAQNEADHPSPVELDVELDVEQMDVEETV